MTSAELTEELKKEFTHYVRADKRMTKNWPKDRFVFLTEDSMYCIYIRL